MTTSLPTSPSTPSSEQRLAAVAERIASVRESLLTHRLYKQIHSLDALHTFMEHHVFAVWDFMLLLKSLQRELCSVSHPWLPPQDGTACRLINEIVLGEESDEDGRGGYASHFELYRRSMLECGANVDCMDAVIAALRMGQSIPAALHQAGAPAAVVAFVERTCAFIDSGDLCVIASAFTFGREDLLPDVFQKIVDELNFDTQGRLSQFQYYLARHIELDADQHGPMAERLIASLCGDDDARWQAVETAAVQALEARAALWDAVSQQLAR